jgi:TfoX/Sxy family transcriptional regulator of competence genes
MAYNELLTQRIREILNNTTGITEKKMFGGVGFMLLGNMVCGVNQDDLIVRVGSDKHAEALSRPHTRVFDMTGKPMSGWIRVSAEGYTSDEELKGWVRLGLDCGRSLPPK